MGPVVGEIVDILGGGLTSFADKLGSGLSHLVEKIFLDYTGDAAAPTLSVFGGVVCIFGGISLAIALSRWVVNWVTSLGASH